MAFEKAPPLEDANTHIHFSSLIGFKTPPDDSLPLHTHSRVVSRVSRSWKTGFLVIGTFCLLLAFVHNPLLSWSPSIQPPTISRNPAHLIVAEHGAVATENKRCSDIGVNILQKGGNAVDAAISAGLCIGVVNMFSSGIGGGGFMTVRVPLQGTRNVSEVFTIDFRETAPSRAHKTMYVGDPMTARRGGLAVAVPGELRGFEEAHRRWKNLEWHDLVRPIAELATEWTVDAELARRMQMYSDLLLHNQDWSAIFAPEGKLLLEGDTIRHPNLSDTLKVIAKEGPGAFYKGPIADSIVSKVQETGGVLTHKDLEKYTAKVERALKVTYNGKKVYTSRAPSSGPALLHMLNLLEQFDLITEGRTPLNVHRIVEAIKFGFAARTRLGDLAFYTGDERHAREIVTKKFARQVRAMLTDDRTHPPEYYKPEFDIETEHGTTHISVVDENGMAVSMTSTINWMFGSQVLDPETGVILNDEMDDFSIPGVANGFGLRPSPHNYPQPGKRPLSSTAPTIVEHADGSFYLAIGGSGGSQIFPAVFQTFLNLGWGMDAKEAVEHGRVHHQLYPNWVDADNALPCDELQGLWERGNEVHVLDVNRISSAVQVVLSEGGEIYAASDSRKNGIAAGY